jgi:PAS domain S-box-containing protein
VSEQAKHHPSTRKIDERLCHLVEAVRDYAIFLLEPDGTVASWNQGAEKLKGYRREEIVGQHFSRFYPEEDRKAGRPERLLQIARTDGRVEEEGWRVRKDGTRFWADVVITALFEGDKLVGYAKVTRDVSDRRATEDRLRQTEERTRLMVDSVKDYAIFMLDPDGHVATWNEGAERIKQYRPEEIVGSHISRFYAEEDRQAGRPQRLLGIARTEGRVEDEGWRVRKDGTRFWADVVITALRDHDGKLVGFTKVTRDLTERRAAEERLRTSEERLRLMVDAVKDYAIFMLDPEGRVASWNYGAERIKGYKAEEIIGQHFSRFYTEEDNRAGKTKLELEVAARDGRFEDEGWRVRKDGSRFWANVVITPVRTSTGALLGFTKITRDLTDRKRLEEERLRLAQAEESIRLRDEFLSIASHELKTPLTALQLQLQAVAERVRRLDEAIARKVDRASRSGDRLADLIETLLDVSRIATGRFELVKKPFDLGEAAREVTERMREAAINGGCEVTVTSDRPVVGSWDRLRVEQVLVNLLSNAIKYAAGTPIEIGVSTEGQEAVLRVRDHGPGVAPTELDRIWGRFERAASMRHYGGLGLGLYVARQIVEAHGGKVEAANAEGGGAIFTMRLPRVPLSQLTDTGEDAPKELH